MAELLVDTRDLEAARTAAAGAAGPLSAAGEGLPLVPTTAFGTLAVAATAVRAVSFVTAQVHQDLVTGADHLRQVDLALQQTMEEIRALDDAGAGSFAPPPGG